MQQAPGVPSLLQSNRQTLPKRVQRPDNERRVTVNVVAAPMQLPLPQSPQLSCASPLSVSPVHSLLPTPNGSAHSTPRCGGPYSPSTSPIPLRPQPLFMSRSADQLPGLPSLPFPSLLARRPQSQQSPQSCQGAKGFGVDKAQPPFQGQGFEVRDFPLGMVVFDPANPSLRAQLLGATLSLWSNIFSFFKGT